MLMLTCYSLFYAITELFYVITVFIRPDELEKVNRLELNTALSVY